MEKQLLKLINPGEAVTPQTEFKLANGLRVAHNRSFQLDNANGNVSEASLAYQYTVQTTTAIRQDVIRQKFYEVNPGEFMSISVGLGAWMEDIKTNLEYQIAGGFEGGYVSTAQSPSNLMNVDVANSSVDAKLWTWIKGYRYSIIEVNKALAFNNWNVIEAKIATLLKHAQLGIQKVAFLGNPTDLAGTPGLYSNQTVTVNTSVITAAIKSLSSSGFQTLIASLLAAYFANSNNTQLPDTFVMPMSDFLGMSVFVNPAFPLAGSMMIDVLRASFREITGNANFQVKGCLYGQAAANAGYWNSNGTNRYVLYKNDAETIRMDMPVAYTMFPAVPVGAINFEGALAMQHSGAIAYRPAQMLYFDY